VNTMHNSEGCQPRIGHGHHRGRGPSSFWMHDPEAIFGEIGLKSGDAFLDLGCGPGDYALYAAGIVGYSGAVYAVDRWDEMINTLLGEAASQGLENIIGVISDITAPLPLRDRCVDVCFIATVLHTLDINRELGPLLDEIRRVLNPGGHLAIIECKKQDQSFGPPQNVRMSPGEVEALVIPCGFEKTGFTDLDYNYLIQFGLLKQ
jgi:ubiquinone/menaquinone biosynthesis C-methylase UbiE